MTVVDDVLKHYGVRGMRWGVRRNSSSAPTGVSLSVKTTRKQPQIVTKGGSNQPPHVDALKAAIAKQQAKSSGSHSLSNDDLRTLIARMNLEQQYTKLATQTKKKSGGKAYVTDLITTIAKTHVSKIANDAAAKQIATALGSSGKHRRP